MKNLGLILLAMLTLGGLTGCEKVPAGNVGIKVFLTGGNKGVDHETLPVGRYWIGINEELYLFPTFEQNPKYTAGAEDDAGRSIEFQTREGMAVDADFSVTYNIDPKSASLVFQRYRSGIHEINSGPLRNILRDAVNEVASQLPVEAVYGEGKTEMVDNIQKEVQRRAAEAGITVTQVSLLGAMRLPATVTNALNAKLEATQRAQQRENELREAEAQARKEVATAEGAAKMRLTKAKAESESILMTAKAQAEANQILSRSLTKELIDYEKINKWDGKLPTFSGGGMTPLVNIDR